MAAVREMMFILSHPTGNAFVREAALALAEAGLLEEFHTTLAFFGNGWRGELRRRVYPDALRKFTRRHPWREAARLVAGRLGVDSLIRHETGWASVDAVYRSLDREVAKAVSSPAVYCYEDGALETFRAAEQRGAARIYDLPIGYWRAARRILSEEAERRLEWAATLSGLRDSAEKLERKDEELRLADHIVVASSFTKRTLEECPFPVAPISLVPYGAAEPCGELQPVRRDGPLRVLFVGSLSQRKGIADVFESLGTMGRHAELTVIGRRTGAACKPLDEALTRCRWIPSLPRDRILEEMRRHDVLVFPSLFEGFGLVVTEALSQGLPVITTAHTCGPDVLEDGVEGFLVPTSNPEAITEKLDWLDRDRNRIEDMRQAARKKARSLSWSDYRRRIVEVVSGSTPALRSVGSTNRRHSGV
jgi:glycosyltransferase involved in cell wall biosynthesis